MKKLKMDLNGIGELLNKEQMKMVTGGQILYDLYVSCEFTYLDYPANVNYPPYDKGYVIWGSSEVPNCHDFCWGKFDDGPYGEARSEGTGCQTDVRNTYEWNWP
jgi:hypothetical protein